jgi:hypothetical protein
VTSRIATVREESSDRPSLGVAIDGRLVVTDEPGRRIDEPAFLAVVHVLENYSNALR